MAGSGSILGNAVRRVEDPAILRGEARYFDDLVVEGLAHIVFVRSTIAHANVTAIDTQDTETMPGVLGVYTHHNLELAPLRTFPSVPAALGRPPLADGTVRFVGDIVAAVVAESRAQAVDAAELVVVDYAPLPAVTDPEAALADGAPLLFPEHGSNLALDIATMGVAEDPTVLEGADVVVEGRFVNQRLACVPLEPNGVLVEPGDTLPGAKEMLRFTIPTQAPHNVREQLATALGIESDKIRVLTVTVGGGFGAKNGCYPEFVIAAATAQRLGRPVKWTETRSENMVALTHGRAQIQHVSMGLKRDGTIVGLKVRIIGETGAYPGFGMFLPYITRTMSQGVYEIPKVDVGAVSVLTNATTISAYRGAGRPEATALVERIVDMAADELEIDPVELRRKNFIAPESFPYITATGATYDVGEYAQALDEACRLAGYERLKADQQARRERGDVIQLGIGVCTYVEVTAGRIGQEFGGIEVRDDGTVVATVGTSAHGQGHETSFAMIVSDLLGVPMDQVHIVQSDTALVPRGRGTMGSRSLQIGGSAIYRASEEVVVKAKRLAAHLLEASVDDIVVHDGGAVGVAGGGGVGVAGVPARALSWAELAQAAADPDRRPPDWDPGGPGKSGLESEFDFQQADATYPFGAHIAVVEVDMETGRVRLIRHIAVDDCGRILNPLLVTGQQHGGIAQGVAQALYEEFVYDEDGNPLTANLMDYAMPSAAELPSFETANTETPTHLNPLGAKGIGESGTIGAGPAVQNAVVDALSHLGVRHVDMPLTSERVWRAIRDASASFSNDGEA